MSTSAPVLEAFGLTKRYGGLPAVTELTFAMRPGETLGCLGPNGSGKSTTVKMLTGLLKPTSGRICFRGQDIHEQLTEYKSRLGYVPEEPQLYSFLTGWEYLELTATLRRMRPGVFQEKARELLRLLSLEESRHSLIGSYSKGMRQRILLIAALIHDPELLILDEPFSGLDVTTALICRRALELLGRHGKSIFFCSPVLESVERVCSHLLLLRKGRLVAHGALDEIRSSIAQGGLEDMFLQLTEQADVDGTAQSIVEVVRAPAR